MGRPGRGLASQPGPASPVATPGAPPLRPGPAHSRDQLEGPRPCPACAHRGAISSYGRSVPPASQRRLPEPVPARAKGAGRPGCPGSRSKHVARPVPSPWGIGLRPLPACALRATWQRLSLCRLVCSPPASVRLCIRPSIRSTVVPRALAPLGEFRQSLPPQSAAGSTCERALGTVTALSSTGRGCGFSAAGPRADHTWMAMEPWCLLRPLSLACSCGFLRGGPSLCVHRPFTHLLSACCVQAVGCWRVLGVLACDTGQDWEAAGQRGGGRAPLCADLCVGLGGFLSPPPSSGLCCVWARDGTSVSRPPPSPAHWPCPSRGHISSAGDRTPGKGALGTHLEALSRVRYFNFLRYLNFFY